MDAAYYMAKELLMTERTYKKDLQVVAVVSTECLKYSPAFGASVMFFTRESSYCFQRVLAIAILFVRLSRRWISQKRCKLGSPYLCHRLPGRL